MLRHLLLVNIRVLRARSLEVLTARLEEEGNLIGSFFFVHIAFVGVVADLVP